MEDNKTPASGSNAFSPRSAQTLRELEERARAALSVQRGQVSRLEQEIFQQLDAITSAIAEQHAAESDQEKLVGEARSQLEKLRKEIDETRAIWQREREEQKNVLEKERKELESRGAKQDQRSKQLADLGCELDARHVALDEQASALSQREAKLEERAASLSTEAAQRSAEHDDLATREAAWKDERKALEVERNELTQDFAAREAVWKDERKRVELERDELAEKLARVEAQQRTGRDESQEQLDGFEQKLHEQQASWNEQRAQWDKARAELEHEHNELKQKFELALEDVQRYRSRVAELEQDLARRPEASQADSAELVALRAERDALTERVEELERQPAASDGGDNAQQVADLQRRFELAVEDVRELKTKNAELESRIAAVAKKSTGHHGDAGGMDWESQKRRMLASLEGEGDEDIDEVREKERASIENTIEMTDAVVAEKDREIEELKVQLAEAATAKVEPKDDGQEKLDELLDADEVIAEHRKRISQLERDMQDKLRTAELELSVERAKLARHKAELEEMRNDIESQRAAFGSGAGGVAGTPRRRWLSKLGLAGDEE